MASSRRRIVAQSLTFLLLASVAPSTSAAQTGPWARYSAVMKGEALIRESDGGYLAEVRSIIEGGGDVNWQMERSGFTPLMAAATGGHAAVVEYLLKAGANPALEDAQGMTALDRAVRAGATDVVRVLRAAAPAAARPAGPPAVAGSAPAPAPPPVPAPGRPAPARPGRPAPPPVVAPAPVPAPVPAPAKATLTTRWAPFGSYRVGDRVTFHLSTGWRSGTVRAVGTSGVDAGSGQPAKNDAMKYRISDDRYRDDGEWHDWGRVAGTSREPFWVGFFVGDWRLGETMAVNSRVEGTVETTTYSFGSATEALRVEADGNYRWRRTGKAELRGRWSAASDGPGIVLHAGDGGKDWTFRNETNGIEVGIRGIETGRLTAPGVMSVAAKRPAPGTAR